MKTLSVRDFIYDNYTPYYGTESFLKGPTEKTTKLWNKIQQLQREERKRGGVLDCETEVVSDIYGYAPGYVDKDLEVIVGLQTDRPLKRAFMPNGGIKTAVEAAGSYGYKVNPKLVKIFNNYRKTHNEAVFDVYTEEQKRARHCHIITGLPDTYGRGRIVGDYRRVALYGTDSLIKWKQEDLREIPVENIQLREEVAEQIKALEKMSFMANTYGYDIRKPARNAREAAQWLYFGYLAAIRSQNGAAMSVGRISTFLDIYIEKDLKDGILDEVGAQEIIDQLVLKLRMVRFARIPSYNELFSGDPVWATIVLGGMTSARRSMVTKTDFRFLRTLENMGPAPEPNLTVLYDSKLPEGFKKYAARISIETSSIQYENDEEMKWYWGDDYSVCCCVSGTSTGQSIQYFGARANLAKCLLYALNDGQDEKFKDEDGKPIQVAPRVGKLQEGALEYDEVIDKFDQMMDWLAEIYVSTLNTIHYMHDKYNYEAAQMALIDTNVDRTFATGIAGFSHVVDSLSAIKYARVTPVRDQDGITVSFKIEGDFPKYGNDDDRADEIAKDILHSFILKIKEQKTYRDSKPTTSILTITSNVVYGKATGATPDGRAAWAPFAPGANPAYGAEENGLLASLNSVAKLPYEDALDGISNTQTIVPQALGHTEIERINNLVNILDGYFEQGAQHLNVNVLNKKLLEDAMAHPDDPKYANLTIRVSGYAVKFINLTKEQQLDVLNRTFHRFK